jgi:hypothetical protein
MYEREIRETSLIIIPKGFLGHSINYDNPKLSCASELFLAALCLFHRMEKKDSVLC